jgi:prepilin-type N-terminal cleavage/methylation domain-containing protein
VRAKLASRFRGFTLLEVLVAAAISLVLVAMLLPAIMRTKIGMQRSACLANLRQIGVGFHGYLGENNYRIFPRAASGAASNYIAYIFPYADEKKFYRCPATPTPASFTERTYKINNSSDPSKSWIYDRSYFDIKSPGNTIFVFDRGDKGKRKLFVRDTVEWDHATDVNTTATVISNYPFNHAPDNEGQNLLFMDGSARFQRYPFTNDWYYPR